MAAFSGRRVFLAALLEANTANWLGHFVLVYVFIVYRMCLQFYTICRLKLLMVIRDCVSDRQVFLLYSE